MKITRMILLSLLLLSFAFPPNRKVMADVAPPWVPQGANIKAETDRTKVQMLREKVSYIVEGIHSPDPLLPSDQMIAHVEATFVMKNQGEQEESMAVWFPIHSENDRVPKLENFRVWVDGEAKWITEAPGRNLRNPELESEGKMVFLWATWPMTFPAGREVTVRVTYDSRPFGWGNWGSFVYFLETGSGWYGAIGEGEISFRLPYRLTVWNSNAQDFVQKISEKKRPQDWVKLWNNELVWHFEDLEPDPGDNIELDFLSTAAWKAVGEAWGKVRNEPRSFEAQYELVIALRSCTKEKYGMLPTSYNFALARQIYSAYRRAMAFEPEDPDLLVEYLDWLVDYSRLPREEEEQAVLLSEIEWVFQKVERFAPDDPRIQDINQQIGKMSYNGWMAKAKK